jgi:hypothetical protein
MDVTITVEGRAAPDELRALDLELSDVDELRGRVRPVAMRPRPGELGVLDSTRLWSSRWGRVGPSRSW